MGLHCRDFGEVVDISFSSLHMGELYRKRTGCRALFVRDILEPLSSTACFLKETKRNI